MSAQATVSMLVARTKNQAQRLTSYTNRNIYFFAMGSEPLSGISITKSNL